MDRTSGGSRVKPAGQQGGQPAEQASGDGLVLSPAADRFRQLRARIEGLPDSAHAEKLARLKAQVDSGAYTVDAQRVAKAMLDDEPTAALLGVTPPKK
jgi:flagellar biosynthesis anti-sigma factor FlgM